MFPRFIVITALGLLVSSCATQNGWPELTAPNRDVAETMAGKIGCPGNEIRVRDQGFPNNLTATSWQANCRGQDFVCSVAPGRRDLNEMSCAHAVESDSKVIPAYDPSADPADDPLGG